MSIDTKSNVYIGRGGGQQDATMRRSYRTSLTTTGKEATAEQQRAAAVTCAAHATSAPELVELLDMLGILEDVPA